MSQIKTISIWQLNQIKAQQDHKKSEIKESISVLLELYAVYSLYYLSYN